ncbi:hypothetical protein JCM10908_007402 [Rhodotorula pacifica]|uniref:uncharacterized protein n=1 Tax=Rhodotorula pacifica TaxID=1495444 RepID=UPI003170D7A9
MAQQPVIPSRDLPLLALAQDIVIFPALVVSIHLASPHAQALLAHLDANNNSSSPETGNVIACVPRKASPTVQNRLADAANRLGTGDKLEQLAQVIRDDGHSQARDRETAEDGAKIDPNDLFEYGTACRIVRFERTSSRQASSGGYLVVLEGLARISFDPLKALSAIAPSDSNPDLAGSSAAPVYALRKVTVHHPSSTTTLGLSAKDAKLLAPLRDAATAVLDALTQTSPSPLLAVFERRLRTLISRLSLASAPSLIDALFGTLPISTTTSSATSSDAATAAIGLTTADKLLILSLVSAPLRLEKAIAILSRAREGLSTRDRIDQSVARRQREFALLQQLLAIRSELDQLAKEGGGGGAGSSPPGGSKAITLRNGNKKAGGSQGRRSRAGEEAEDEDEEDEMAELERKIDAKRFSDEARKVALREMKRLKKTPPQGAEHGVIRTYLETLLAIPWTDADSTPLPLSRDFVAQARKKLDQDHYGLDKIKKRLLEWLAVLRLQQQQWQADLAAASTANKPALLESAAGGAAPVSASTDAAAATTETALVLRDASVPPPPPAPANQPAATPDKPASPPYKAPILLLHGPPGVGKTSIARSLAEAMGRKFIRISLGGVRDEAEIRGHRRTYVGAMPGKVVAALRKCGVKNPVVLLDEVDKMGHQSMHGDPSAAMLEVLDPEQNHAFEDHYLGVPVDLSQVLFIATANSLDTIPEPLYDRMEAIELSGYVHDEKLHIARQSLLPKQLRANALSPELVSLTDEVLLFLITSYTREAGVRSLERHIGSVCRAKAVEYSEARDQAAESDKVAGSEPRPGGYRTEVTREDVERILGPSRFDEDEGDRDGRVGVVNGLAYQGSGNGGILSIETTAIPGSGKFNLTGSLGDVISESAHVAFAWVRAHAFDLGIASAERENAFKAIDVHLHMPAGAVKKDGPSAGVAMTVAMISLMRGVPPRKGVAMTGEVTLRGAVTPVGGIREKVLAAHRAGMQRVILPSKNRRDIDTAGELPAQVKAEVEFVFVDAVEDAIEAAFEGGWEGVTGKPRSSGVGAHGQTWLESHL